MVHGAGLELCSQGRVCCRQSNDNDLLAKVLKILEHLCVQGLVLPSTADARAGVVVGTNFFLFVVTQHGGT